eukprot:6591182-Pyramimonas_sp.AAC.1
MAPSGRQAAAKRSEERRQLFEDNLAGGRRPQRADFAATTRARIPRYQPGHPRTVALISRQPNAPEAC